MLVAAFAITGGSATAQSPAKAEDEGIVVEAPRLLPPPPGRSSFSGAPIVTTTVKIQALYGDLDLTQPANAARLMIRIERVAQDACKYLDGLYPLSPDAGCVDRAIANATPAAKAIIAAAGQ
jgi:UrcA family protein